MQTLPTAEASTITGGVQTPLLTEDQLEVGVFITGNTSQHVWRVTEVDRARDIVTLQKQPAASLLPDHQHEFVLNPANPTCACGLRQQHIQGDAVGIMPLRANTPRVYIIRPTGPLVMPDMFTTYLTALGRIVKMTEHGWSTVLPIVPALHPVWTLPIELRDRLK